MTEHVGSPAASKPSSEADSAEAPRERVRRSIRADASLPRDELKSLVERAQLELQATLSKCDAANAKGDAASDEWTARELLRHVIAVAERVTAQTRALAAGQDPPEYDVSDGEMMRIADGGERYSRLLERLDSAHAGLLAAIDIALEGDRVRTSNHGYFGPFTALEWAGFQRFHIGITLPHARQRAGAR